MAHQSCLRWTLLGVLACQAAARAVVTTDGSLGPHASFSGSNVLLPASLGRQKGGNLFHSFGQFDVPDGGSVTFAGPASVKNVLARVTGGQASHIDGTLGSSIPGANLYLINPAGVVFGPNGQLNVSGSFTATTADVVRLADGAKFAVDRSGDGVLSGASPAGFGFLSARPGQITLNGAILVTAGPAVRLAGGAIATSGGAAVATPGGHISLAAVTRGDLTIDPARGDLAPAVGTTRGPIALADTNVVTDGTGGGRIDVTGASLAMTNSNLSAQTLGDHPGGGISVDLLGDLGLNASAINTANSGTGRAGDVRISASMVGVLNGGFVTARTYAAGPAGAVAVRATTLRVEGVDADDNNSFLSTDSASPDAGGPAGTLSIAAQDLRLSNDGAISADTSGRGAAGTVTITAGRMTVDGAAGDNGTFVSAGSLSGDSGAGAAGHVAIRAGRLSVLNSASIAADTYGPGTGGTVAIHSHALTVSGTDAADEGAFISSSSNSQADGGAAGGVSVLADRVDLTHGGTIESDTAGGGAGGLVAVRAGVLNIVQGGGDLLSGISSSTEGGTGAAGDVRVAAGTLTLLDGGQIRTDTAGPGNAGRITVQADDVRLDGGPKNRITAVHSQTVAGSSGSAGDVTLTARSLAIARGGEIGSDTAASGPAGTVNVHGDRVRINGNGISDPYTGISSQSNVGATGPAGDVNFTAATAALVNGGEVTSGTHTGGAGGTVTATLGTLTVDGGGSSAVFTGLGSECDPGATGNAGGVRLTATHLTIQNGGEVSSDTFGGGRAGTVDVTAGAVLVDGKGKATLFTGIGSNANSTSTGDAGDVAVTAKTLTLLDDAQLSSSTFGTGSAGAVTVHAGPILIDGFEAGPNAITGIVSQAVADSAGNAGSVNIAATTIDMVRGGEISSGTFSTGNAGQVTVHADAIRIDATGRDFLFTGIDSQSNRDGGGAAGDVSVTAGTIGLFNGGTITSNTFGAGPAGTVAVRAGSLRIGSGGESSFFTGISSRSGAGDTGPAGDVNVVADSIAITNGGAISSDTFGRNHAGTVVVKSKSIRLDGANHGEVLTAIDSEAKPGVSGAAGSVRVTAGTIDLIDTGYISSDTGGTGEAGTVRVKADALRINGGEDLQDFTGVGSESFLKATGGRAGTVDIDVGTLSLSHGGQIRASSEASAAGDISVRVAADLDASRSTFSTESFASNGGNVSLSAGGSVRLDQVIVTAQAAADGGNVRLSAAREVSVVDSFVTAQAGTNGARLTIDPLFVLLNRSTLDGRANGVPVRVSIDPRAVFLESNESRILADNPTLPPDVDLTGAILHFVVPQFGGQTVLAEGCEMQLRKRNLSSFVAQERLGLPPVPGQGVLSGVVNAPLAR